ncbi:hypothetical protein [Nonomuraea pusilla]|nr:hypothetical protein [Nonomuraea pusilla]
MMRQYAGNRIGLAVVGATLLVLGGYAWLRGHGRLLDLSRGGKVLPQDVVRPLSGDPWPLWTLALVLALLAVLCLRWLLLALGYGRRGVRAGTATAMLCVGLKSVDGLARAGVRVAPQGIRIALTCPSATDMGAVVAKLDQDIVGRIRREVGDDETGAVVRLHVRR